VWFETTSCSLKLFYEGQPCCHVAFAVCEALPDFRGLRGFSSDPKKLKLSFQLQMDQTPRITEQKCVVMLLALGPFEGRLRLTAVEPEHNQQRRRWVQ